MTRQSSSRGGFHPVAARGGADRVNRLLGRPFGLPGKAVGVTPSRLLSRRIRRAFSDPLICDEPPSDCWPAEIISGGVSFHGAGHDSTVMTLSPGKSRDVTDSADGAGR